MEVKKMSIDKPNDDVSKTNIEVVFQDGRIAKEITDVWVRKGNVWINIIPPNRTYKVSKITIT